MQMYMFVIVFDGGFPLTIRALFGLVSYNDLCFFGSMGET